MQQRNCPLLNKGCAYGFSLRDRGDGWVGVYEGKKMLCT